MPVTATRDRNLPANLKLEAPPPQYDQEKMRQAFRIIEQHWHLQNPAVAGGSVCFDIICGEGSPEGVVTAVKDSLYVQTDFASTSHPYWVKISGSGNTGWRAWTGLRGSDPLSFRIGDGADGSKPYTIAFGEGAQANNEDQINIGRGNSFPVSVDDFANAEIALGSDNVVTFNSTDFPSSGDSFYDIAIGTMNTIEHSDFQEQIQVLGGSNDVRGAALNIVGYLNTIKPQGPDAADLAHAGLANAATYGAVLGQNVNAWADCFVAVGYHTECYGIGATALGPHASAGVDSHSIHTTAVGRFAKAYADRSLAIGAVATTTDGYEAAIALGAEAWPLAANELMIGSRYYNVNTVRFNGFYTGGAAFGDDNYAAPDLRVIGPQGSGAGAAGAIVFESANVGASGRTTQTTTARLRVSSAGVAVERALTLPIATVTTDTTLDASHHTVLVNDTNPHTITLPTAASAFAHGSGRVYVVKRIGTGAVTLAANGVELIDTANTYAFGARYDALTIQSDGTQWWITSAS